MLLFFGNTNSKVFVVETPSSLSTENIKKLQWLFGNVPRIKNSNIDGNFVGPRANMITPWSTNAVEITENMGIGGIRRIEEYLNKNITEVIDPMLFVEVNSLNQKLFSVNIKPKNAYFELLDHPERTIP